MIDDTHLYLDIEALRRRGWTEALVAKFLGEEDRRVAVNHWLNFAGKRVYFLGRVEQAESSAAFQKAYLASLRRRRIDEAGAAEFMAQRARTAGAVRRWEESLSDDDRQTLEVLGRVGALFKEARRRGWRTPHKA
jgi:hypothetical protein